MIRVYINPFDDSGAYSGYQEVTENVELSSIGTLTQAIDFNEYDVGGVKISDTSITVRNTDGLYADVGGIKSIFRYKRSNSKVKITWTPNPYSPKCGMAICGTSPCGDIETVVFEGLLNDQATAESVEKQNISFKVLGFDSVLSGMSLPVGSPANGQTHETSIYNILNQAPFNELVNVDIVNINCDSNETIEVDTDFEDDTVKEALEKLLSGSNSVMTISYNTVFITNRNPSLDLKHTFRGQASEIGEDISKISAAKNGQNRLFNYISWEDTAYFKQETSSIDKYLIKEKVISLGYLSSQTKIEGVLQSTLDAFSIPKREFELTTFLSQETIELELLDKVKVDYPTPLVAPVGDILPIYGLAFYDEDKYPFANFTIVIDEATDWKIITRKVDLKNKRLILKLREA